MVEVALIKCIIWDLDNTLWSGILAEDENVVIGKAKEVLEISSKVGVINSICSKNNEIDVKKKLKELGIEHYFVFNSICYKPKGLRVREQINSMKLKKQNVLFIDDEVMNLKEVQFYNQGIMLSQPYIIEELIKYFQKEFDNGKRTNRIQEYKRMEYVHEISKTFETNEDFLMDSNIQVRICNDVINVVDRLYELCLRTNQLNFTKKRSSKEQLIEELNNSENSGYIRVSDKYGDYGIVGYYVICNSKLLHYVFSCRIMNMGVEQYVYRLLKKPYIRIIGEVASELDGTNVYWINSQKSLESVIDKHNKVYSVLLKGSCDLRRMKLFLPSCVEYEVPYMSVGKNIVYQTGIPTMAMTLLFSLEEIEKRINNIPFFSMEYYCTKLFDNSYDVVVLSTISLGNLGVYVNHTDDFFVSMGLPEEPMYLEQYEKNYYSGEKYANGFSNTPSMFSNLRNQYNYIYDEYVDNYLSQHLSLILDNISSKKTILILGNEERYSKNKSRAGTYFSKVNKIIEQVASQKECKCVNISDLVNSSDDVINHFNHFSSVVYYKLSRILCDIFEEDEDE